MNLNLQTIIRKHYKVGVSNIIDGVVKVTSGKTDSHSKTAVELVLVLDKSGSMSGTRINNAKKSIIHVINNMGPEDIFHLITFNYNAQLIFQNKTRKDNAAMIQMVNNIRSTGGTHLQPGLQRAKQILLKSKSTNKHMFVFTDGEIQDDNFKCFETVHELEYMHGITTSSFGLGTNYNSVVIRSIGQYGKGCYYYIKDANEIASKFENAFNLMSTVIYKNAVLKINGANGSVMKNICDNVTGSIDTVSIGNLFKDDERVFLFEMIVNPKTGLPFINVELTMDGLDGQKYKKTNTFIPIITDDPALLQPIEEVTDRKIIYRVSNEQKKIPDLMNKGFNGKMEGMKIILESLELLDPIHDLYPEASMMFKALLDEKEQMEINHFDVVEKLSAHLASYASQPISTF